MANGVKLPNGGKLQIFVNHTEEIGELIKSLGLEDKPDNSRSGTGSCKEICAGRI